MVDLTIVIPSYNGRKNLSPLVKELVPVLEGTGLLWEILFVDDCSTDGLFEEISLFHRQDRRIRAVRLKENRGQQNAVYCGLNEASGELIITMDDDLQHPPSIIPLLIAKVLEGFDLVYAVDRSSSRSLILRAGTALNGLFFSFFLKKPFVIEIGSYRIMKRELVNRIKGDNSVFIYVSALIFRLKPRPEVCSFRFTPPVLTGRTGSRFNMKSRFHLFRKLFVNYGPFRFLLNKESPIGLRSLCVRRGCTNGAKGAKPSSPQQAAVYSAPPNKQGETYSIGDRL